MEIQYLEINQSNTEKKQWLKKFFDKHIDKETKLFIDEQFDASVYKEWLQNH